MSETRNETIEKFMLQEMAKANLEPTINNKISYLEGLRDGFKEDPEESLEKTMWVTTVNFMLISLRTQKDLLS